MEKKVGRGVMRLVRGDITDLDVEAFVYDITEDVQLGSGYGGAIQQRGGPSIQKELNAIGSCPKGHAVVTGAGELKARHIIHTNGPKFHEEDTEGKLERCVVAVLEQAEKKGITQVAFPPIGTGLYQVPLDVCARVMMGAVEAHLKRGSTVREVIFVALDSREHAPFAARFRGGF